MLELAQMVSFVGMISSVKAFLSGTWYFGIVLIQNCQTSLSLFQ
jgi:hypothetical protein